MKKFLSAVLASAFVFSAGCDNVTVSKGGLSVADVSMALNQEGPAVTERKFKRGVPTFILFTITGIKQADDDQVWVQQDLAVEGPDGKNVFSKENMVDLHSKADKGSNQATFNNKLTLPEDTPLGAYTASIKVRDKISGGTTSTTLKFTLED